MIFVKVQMLQEGHFPYAPWIHQYVGVVPQCLTLRSAVSLTGDGGAVAAMTPLPLPSSRHRIRAGEPVTHLSLSRASHARCHDIGAQYQP